MFGGQGGGLDGWRTGEDKGEATELRGQIQTKDRENKFMTPLGI